MKTINIEEWKRKDHFHFFHRMDYLHFNICMNIDATHFLDFVHANHISFYYAMIYAATQAANHVDELRYRIRDHQVVLHDEVHPAFSDMSDESDLFKMVLVDIDTNDIISYSHHAKEVSMAQKVYFDFAALGGRDDLLYITSIPWISFTHLSHTISLNKNNSVPRISWGKYFKDGNKTLLPFSVQVNHALADGVHRTIY